MLAVAQERRARRYLALASLLARPGADLAARVAEAREACGDGPAKLLSPFELAAAKLSPSKLDEIHLGTFDLVPCCIPYLSVHLFGEESFQRAELMTALVAAYRRSGFDHGTELPDHIEVVLRYAAYLPDDEFHDLLTHCLIGPVARMHESLDRDTNPYRFVLAAILRSVQEDLGEEH